MSYRLLFVGVYQFKTWVNAGTGCLLSTGDYAVKAHLMSKTAYRSTKSRSCRGYFSSLSSYF